MPKISKRAVDAASPDPARRYFLWDTELKGFGLLVLPSGVKSYVYQYGNQDGDSRRMTRGKPGPPHPERARQQGRVEDRHARADRYARGGTRRARRRGAEAR